MRSVDRKSYCLGSLLVMARFTQKQSDSPETPGLHEVWRARSRLRKAIARGGERLDIEAIRAVFD